MPVARHTPHDVGGTRPGWYPASGPVPSPTSNHYVSKAHPHFPHWSRRSHADRHHHNAHIGTSGARATHAAPPPASYHKAAHEKLPHGWRQAGPGLYFNVVTGAMTAEHPLPLPKHWRLEKSAGTRGGIGGGEIYFVNVRTHQSLPFLSLIHI